jgi:hypothetical protein
MFKWGGTLVVGLGILLTATLADAMEEYAGNIADFRLYLIWDDDGQMSKDLSHQREIVAISRRHASIQARVDIILDGHKGAMGNDPLELSVHSESMNGETHDTTYELPVGYFAKNRMIRSIIVTHDCSPFEVNATLGNSHRTLKVDRITCGD